MSSNFKLSRVFPGNPTSWAFTDTGTEREHYVHARYGCIMERYPYFWNGLVEMDADLIPKLTEEHRAHLMEMFGLRI